MKRFFAFSACAAALVAANASYIGGSRVSRNVSGCAGGRVGRVDDSRNGKIGEPATKREAMLREATDKMNKMRNVPFRKISLPQGAEVNSRPVDFAKRIDSLCGFDIGLIARGFLVKVNDEGDIVATNRLVRPFRGCRQAELVYSKENCALFQIKVFSEPKKMSDEAAREELRVYADAIIRKFGEKVKLGEEHKTPVGNRFLDQIDNDVRISALTGQRFFLRREKVKMHEMATMKKPGAADVYGWTFSIVLYDSLIVKQPLLEPVPRHLPKASRADVDAL